jgi:hypothetical protein
VKGRGRREGEGEERRREWKKRKEKDAGERKESLAREAKQVDIWTEWKREIGNNRL